ncbi:class II fructose-bisphosphate aldolase [Ructibacterium gallinarum]|uniref:Class II fructose-bisphosphate aldolase n=1 Tax=Ructibacterium gallinarum TaxID=2779355 RepID=A0A9D5LYS3_9FIRM|nr:class II fructose-bisphosphate aldolase [Ructibacterium gallinarum]MBE5039382.1 class II fructose-bisphosphate aldolase [Ructibacterium gallinarum]
MLTTLKAILKIAEANNCAIGAFNTPNLASLKAVIGAAEELNQPAIIMHAQIHEEMGICKMEEIAPIMLFMADKATVPICVHLDHGTDLGYIKRGLDIGFTSIMYDGSEFNEKINYANTCIAVELAARYGASVEAEIGSMGARESENGTNHIAGAYTEPEVAYRFARETKIDALACAFGTAHGVYLKQPQLDFERLKEIHHLVDIPLVMHGGSGISSEDYKKVIALGIRKINYYTYMAKAGGTAVANLTDKTFFHDIEVAAINGMKDNVQKAMRIFSP